MERLTDVFFDVKRSYQKQVEQLFERGGGRFKKENKKLAILISPDSKLYGDLTEKVFKLFLKKTSSYDEAVIIGKIGVELVKEHRLNKGLKVFLLNKFKLTKSDLHLLARKFMNFEQVDVYHPKFDNLVVQIPSITNISGDKPKPLVQNQQSETKTGFLVEPSIENVFEFFKTQALVSLFKGTLGESELALLASRIKAMERATDQIDKNLKEYSMRVLREQRLERDRKQLEQLAGVSLWQTNALGY